MDEVRRRFEKIAGYHVNTMKLIDYLGPISEPGRTVTDGELAKVIGESCKPGETGYARLQSAIRHLLKSKRMLWSRVRSGNAIVCLNDDEAVTHCERERRLIGRRSRRTLQKLATVNPDNLTNGRKTEHCALVAQVGTLAAFASGTTTKKLVERNATKALDIGSALDLMK